MNNNVTLFSLIIPCFNVESYIIECFNSVYDNIPKSMCSNIEIIIVNDCSTDKTGEIIFQYNWQELTNSVIVINNDKNLGISMSRNSALDVATGKYIGWIDPDDIWFPAVSSIISELSNCESDIIEFNAIRFTHASKMKNNIIFRYILENKK